MNGWQLFGLVFIAGGWLGGMLAAAEAEPAGPVDFRRDIAPILETHCVRCHQPKNAKGELSLTTAEGVFGSGVVVARDPSGSSLLVQVTSQGGEPPAMPREGKPLDERAVSLLRRWIEEGAAWPEGAELTEPSRINRNWWSLQPLANVEPPEGSGPEAWRSHSIDRFIAAKFSEQGLSPNPPADRRTLIRRVTYDLIGLPPSPEEVAAFVADDRPEAYEELVDRLLASPRYGEHWGRHWLDVIRFGESRGFERNEIITNLWPFRDYVIRSLNEDVPFDQLVREHLAGDVLFPDDPTKVIASAFLVAGPYDDVGNQDPVQAAQIRADTIDEIIRASSEAFLGMTVGCARCHDHKFDPILQRDYYGLYATFAGIRHGQREVSTSQERQRRDEQLGRLNAEQQRLTKSRDDLIAAAHARGEAKLAEYQKTWPRPPVSRQLTEEVFGPATAKFVRLIVDGQEQNPDARTGYRIEEFEVWSAEEPSRNVALAMNGGVARGDSRNAQDFGGAYDAALVIDGRFGACWLASGTELTIELAAPTSIGRVTFSSDRAGASAGHPVANFVCEYRLQVSVDGETWNEVATSRDRQPMNDAHRRKRLIDAELTDEDRANLASIQQELAAVQQQIAAVPPLPVWWVGTRESTPGPFTTFLGGSPQRAGDAVTPASLTTLPTVAGQYDLGTTSAEGERRLAFANWLVDPTNPLTPRVLANRLWHYHFGIGLVDTPSDFGAMGSQPTHSELLDWLAGQVHETGWRWKPLHKLIVMSETYRQSSQFREDCAAVDGDSRLLWRYPPRRLSAEEVRDTILGVSGKLDLTMGGPGFRLYQYLQDNVATYVPLDRHGPETWRRSIYHHNARAARVDVMTDFDSPDCAFSTPRRAETTTPLQALTMLNHQFTLEMAGFLADRAMAEAGNSPDDQITRVWQLCYQRDPTPDEMAACRELLNQHGLKALCRVVLNTSELIQLE
ncbi:MAG: DUF1553 domain-containing protein [Planctomycetaceae bacterium]|nr:DUF1553 domain-containing protein [Planctomycetaceae bacterium]